MNTSFYYIINGGQTTGPYSLAALREMASVHAFNDSSLVAADYKGTWTAIRDLPTLRAALFPSGKKFALCEGRVFSTVNAPAAANPINVEALLRANIEAGYEPPINLKRYPNRRLREYLSTAVLFNVIGATLYVFLPDNPLAHTFVLGYLGLVNLALYWIFFHIMSRS